ncbi:MAG: LysE family translocator, partial [Alphaproteobacteria bacterium]|nr:LysE family translocator [Alphaproteobacteria bacterium]
MRFWSLNWRLMKPSPVIPVIPSWTGASMAIRCCCLCAGTGPYRSETMDLTNWVLFALTETALAFTPGPAVIYVFSQGFARGMRPALAADAGIITGNIIYFTLYALGLGALILASHNLFLVIKWVGILYLLWIGAGMLFAPSIEISPQQIDRTSHGRIFSGGIMVQLANPKNLLCFLVIFPPFIDPGGNVPVQFLILGVTSVVIEFPA